MKSDADEVTQQVIEIAADVFALDAGTLNAASDAESVEAWDSISHLNLMIAVEQATGVAIQPETMPSLISITKIVEVVMAGGR